MNSMPSSGKLRHIAFICANDGAAWGGSEPLWAQTAERFIRADVRVSIGRRRFANEASEITRLHELGCRLVYRREHLLGDRLARKLFPLEPADLSFVRKLTTPTADLVVISQGNTAEGLRWMEACRQLGQPYAVIAHMASSHLWPGDDTAARLGPLYEQAVASFFVSKANLDLCRRQLSTALAGAKVVRNPFAVSYDANPPWQGNPSEMLSLACVGRLDLNAKGQDLIVDVLNQPRWRDRAVSLTFYGRGNNRNCLEHIIKQTGLANIHFAGHVEGIEQVWARHHAMVLASHFEGLPLAIVEAMLCGRPCIATDVAGNREVIRDGINGFLAQAPTAPLMAATMEEAWARRGQLQSMGQIAAMDIRRLVPRDPIADFFQELQSAADSA
jgi:glycosyltransferase involved in cell wall biosynthesis